MITFVGEGTFAPEARRLSGSSPIGPGNCRTLVTVLPGNAVTVEAAIADRHRAMAAVASRAMSLQRADLYGQPPTSQLVTDIELAICTG